jgi:hypothetical protein
MSPIESAGSERQVSDEPSSQRKAAHIMRNLPIAPNTRRALLYFATAAFVPGCEESGTDLPADTGTSASSTASASSSTDVTNSHSSTQHSDETSTFPDSNESSQVDSSSGTGCTIVPPENWSAANWQANTVAALALRAQLDALVGDPLMRGAEQGTVELVDATSLSQAFGLGTPSLNNVTTTTYVPIVNDAFEEFVSIIKAGNQDLVDDASNWTPGVEGGIYGTSARGINEGGLEVRQIVDKGLFAGAALYNYALSLTAGSINEGTIDSLAALWGANATLDSAGELTDSANYAHQMGFHGETRDALVAAKAFAAAPECESQRDQALVAFFRKWEVAMFARFVFYANKALAETAIATDDDAFAGALHGLSEGVGLAMGFAGVAAPSTGPMSESPRVVSDAAIANALAGFGVIPTDLGASKTGELVESVPNFENAVASLEAIVAESFGLSPAQVAAFRAPTPG